MGAGLHLDARSANGVIQALARKGDKDGALRVFKLMKEQGIARNNVTFNSVAIPFAASGDWERVEDLMFKLRSAGLTYGEREYSCLLSAYAKAEPKQLKRAERVFRDMVFEGVEPNEH